MCTCNSQSVWRKTAHWALQYENYTNTHIIFISWCVKAKRWMIIGWRSKGNLMRGWDVFTLIKLGYSPALCGAVVLFFGADIQGRSQEFFQGVAPIRLNNLAGWNPLTYRYKKIFNMYFGLLLGCVFLCLQTGPRAQDQFRVQTLEGNTKIFQGVT
jgi:hypothetical protein